MVTVTAEIFECGYCYSLERFEEYSDVACTFKSDLTEEASILHFVYK